ncbi:hypothetical protein GE118_01135 [Mycoplasma sp. NEAQ87857]|nr:hypothetical protein GE118_01135 [Mycoplasma sp. NEAQ87857]
MTNLIYGFEILTVILIISLSLPQLFKLLKDKKTGEINFVSFWIFHFGILFWVLYAATFRGNLINVIIADGIGVFVNGIMTYLLYYYKDDFNKSTKNKALILVIFTWVMNIALIAIYIINQTKDNTLTVSPQFSLVVSLIGPSFTTLAFTPQLIKSFKTKQWQGVSYWMFVLYVVNNIVWIIWWILKIYDDKTYGAGDQFVGLIGGLIWQIISLLIFSVQLGFTLYDRHLIKHNKKVIK